MYRSFSKLFILLFTLVSFYTEHLASSNSSSSFEEYEITHNFSYLSTCDCADHNCNSCRLEYTPGSGSGSTGKWADPTVPKRNWTCIQIEDQESTDLTCQMCEVNSIRYVHTMIHRFYNGSLDVGCICAGYMDGTLDNAKVRERDLRNRASRRNNWCSLQGWKTSRNGNPYIKKDANHIVITKGQYGRYSASINKTYLNEWVDTVEEAKLLAFDTLWPKTIRLQ
jgi:hypothetical protein